MNSFFIHESAVVDKGASLGVGTKVWHFSHIMPSAKIGEYCILGQNVFIGESVVLGNNVKVQNNVSLYAGVIIENDVFLGPSCVFTNVINPRSVVERKTEFKKTLVKTGATIGANATVVCGVTLGAFCFVGAGAVVTKNVDDYAVIAGNPAKQIGWMSQMGDKLTFDNSGLAFCRISGEKYQLNNNSVHKIG